MLKKYAIKNQLVFQIWDQYASELVADGQGNDEFNDWSYGFFDNGHPITDSLRTLYRNNLVLQQTYPNPFSTHGNSFFSWSKDLDSNKLKKWFLRYKKIISVYKL
jgi:hypothetical protein